MSQSKIKINYIQIFGIKFKIRSFFRVLKQGYKRIFGIDYVLSAVIRAQF